MLRFGIQSLAKVALIVIGALIVFDWLSTEKKTDNGEEEDAKAEEATSEPDDGKDVEGDAVVED